MRTPSNVSTSKHLPGRGIFVDSNSKGKTFPRQTFPRGCTPKTSPLWTSKPLAPFRRRNVHQVNQTVSMSSAKRSHVKRFHMGTQDVHQTPVGVDVETPPRRNVRCKYCVPTSAHGLPRRNVSVGTFPRVWRRGKASIISKALVRGLRQRGRCRKRSSAQQRTRFRKTFPRTAYLHVETFPRMCARATVFAAGALPRTWKRPHRAKRFYVLVLCGTFQRRHTCVPVKTFWWTLSQKRLDVSKRPRGTDVEITKHSHVASLMKTFPTKTFPHQAMCGGLETVWWGTFP